jgi:nucleotide-binding universal stress UspA family protein
VETKTFAGRPERAIVAEADRFGANLIVVGARGQGSIAATLLGSVSRAVVEDSTCSVLVARGTSVHRIVLAADGSAAAGYATRVIATWPTFAQASVLVLGVGTPAPRYPRAVLRTSEWRAAFRDTIAASTDQACDLVEQAANGLDAAGLEVDVEVRLGDVASEVTAAARAWPADLVILGSSERSRLERLLVDSVPRKVLDGVDCSVLVARPPSEGAPTDA